MIHLISASDDRSYLYRLYIYAATQDQKIDFYKLIDIPIISKKIGST